MQEEKIGYSWQVVTLYTSLIALLALSLFLYIDKPAPVAVTDISLPEPQRVSLPLLTSTTMTEVQIISKTYLLDQYPVEIRASIIQAFEGTRKVPRYLEGKGSVSEELVSEPYDEFYSSLANVGTSEGANTTSISPVETPILMNDGRPLLLNWNTDRDAILKRIESAMRYTEVLMLEESAREKDAGLKDAGLKDARLKDLTQE